MVVALTTEGSSRSFIYSEPPLGWGTGRAAPKKPSGTLTGRVNWASSASESIKKRFDPDSLQASSGVAGHFNSLSVGRRTRFASGCQSPTPPLEFTRNCRGPNAAPPNTFAGLSVATATCEFSNITAPLLKFKVALDDSSLVVTSIFSSCANAAGDCVRTENVRTASCGNSLGCANWMLLSWLATAGGTFIPSSVTAGRGASTLPRDGNTRPSLRVTFAAIARSGFRALTAAGS